VQVDPALANEESLRPHISCAVVRNVKLDNDTIKMVMEPPGGPALGAGPRSEAGVDRRV
jgi:hypothetical protein